MFNVILKDIKHLRNNSVVIFDLKFHFLISCFESLVLSKGPGSKFQQFETLYCLRVLLTI